MTHSSNTIPSIMPTLTINKDFELAYQYVTQTRQHIFLTGKAGTGKTTFLKHLKTNCIKNIVVAAPTGVAAINAGGITLHSLFQLPFTPFIPEVKQGWGISSESSTDKSSLISKLKYNKERLSLLRNLELLVIDEISMVRCDVLDAIDTILRHVRRNHSIAFGGVQLLMIGDLFQLPPVAQQPEWQILKPYYNSEFFFESKALEVCNAVCIELKTIYRQSESTFINLLNAVRTNNVSVSDFNLLNSRHGQKLSSKDYITICSHNRQADEINQNNINKLSTTAYTYRATIEGQFSEYAYPTETNLILKVGAQVMFIKNDVGAARKYFNGKIGKVVFLSKEEIRVQCPEDDFEITVRREEWSNTKYSLDSSSNKVMEESMGSFSQYPLRLAWAVTIHKSQGLTFNAVAIEAALSFSSGQLYVALSRCTTLDGITLLSPITKSALITNDHVVKYYQKISSIQIEEALPNLQEQYVKELLLQLYNYDVCLHQANQLQKLCAANRQHFSAATVVSIDEIYTACEHLCNVGKKFQYEIENKLFANGISSNSDLQGRMTAANNYFAPLLHQAVQLLKHNNIQIESRPVAKDCDEILLEIYETIFTKKYYYQNLSENFSISRFFDVKNNIHIERIAISTYTANKKNTNAPSEVIHKVLYNELIDIRNDICQEMDQPVYLVANQKTIIEMSNYLPQSPKELENITGFGKAKVSKYGDVFLNAIKNYASENNLESNMLHHPKYIKGVDKTTRTVKRQIETAIKNEHGINATSMESFQMFNDGFSIAQIAEKRSFTVSTIEAHLAQAISVGKLKLIDVMDAERGLEILKVIADNPDAEVNHLKTILGNNFSFGEVRMALAQFTRNKLA